MNDSNQIKVSVIAGIYNPPEKLFKQYLEACLNSTIVGCEFILVQDNPFDDISNKILADFETKFKNNKNKFIILRNEKNLGIIPTYNIGMKYATGEYLAFFDTDDYFDLDFLEKMYDYAHANDIDVLSGYSITHFCTANIDESLNFMESMNDDIWVNLFKRSAMVDNFVPYFDDPRIVLNNIKRVMLPRIDRFPMEECTFYHYIRHDNNISKYTDEDMVECVNDRIKDMHSDLDTLSYQCSFILSKGASNV